MRHRQVLTSLQHLPSVTIGGIISSDYPVISTRLSDIVESGPHLEKYCLSPTACQGILRRAAKRGKTLPPALHRALTARARAAMPGDGEKMT